MVPTVCDKNTHTHTRILHGWYDGYCVCVLMQINAVLSVHTHSSASTGQSHNRDEKTVETADSPKAGSQRGGVEGGVTNTVCTAWTVRLLLHDTQQIKTDERSWVGREKMNYKWLHSKTLWIHFGLGKKKNPEISTCITAQCLLHMCL